MLLLIFVHNFSYNEPVLNKNLFYQPEADLRISENVFRTQIQDLYYLTYTKKHDQRGFFAEMLKMPAIENLTGQEFKIQQLNFSYSKTKVVRGLHAEGWNKLVAVVDGEACCVLADVRQNSETFKKVVYFKLNFDPENETGQMLYIPQGVANSICSLNGPVSYIYGVDKLYKNREAKDNLAISIFDPDLKIQWPFTKEEIILSNRDQQAITLTELLKK
ncbi:MAG: hypothetical protein GF390_00795 [Candidatus Pacebacteria bacterium]|nr:hypothetical protein [Candidatus Paceibacterota bacterium]